MEHIIDVTIKDKVAYCSGARYVCGNSDYVIHFDFDDEWTEFETKTARFKCEKGYFDVVFSGDVCAVPVITDTDFFSVGVYAGNIHTTTPASVRVYKSILCGDMDPYVGPPGKDGVGIQSVEQTTTSTEDGGINIVTVTKTDGEASTFEVRNGSRGSVGPAGAAGKDGITPTIGENGNWYLGDTDTGKPSRGEKGNTGAEGADGADGRDGHSPVVTATKSGKTTTISVDGAAIATINDGADGAPGKDGVEGKPGADGADGITPTIGDNGNWYLGDTDTGKPSRGEDGATGATGEKGTDGKSAYAYAVEGGYTGTEDEFAAKLAEEMSGGEMRVTNPNDSTHELDAGNQWSIFVRDSRLRSISITPVFSDGSSNHTFSWQLCETSDGSEVDYGSSALTILKSGTANCGDMLTFDSFTSRNALCILTTAPVKMRYCPPPTAVNKNIRVGLRRNMAVMSTDYGCLSGAFILTIDDEPFMLKSAFTDKTISFYGDSLTQAVPSQYSKGYRNWIVELCGFASQTNRGVSGYRLWQILDAISANTETADCISVMGGYNDGNQWDSARLGSLGDTTALESNEDATGTIYGTVYQICAVLKAKYPTTFLMFITPPAEKNPVSGKVSLAEIRKAILETAELFSIPVYDNYKLSGVNVTNLNIFTSDGTHWTDATHEMIGKNIAKWMLATVGKTREISGASAGTGTEVVARKERVSQFENDIGYATKTYVQNQIGLIPEKLPNPNALTFTGAVTGIYDGSAAMTVNIPSAVTDAHINSLIDTKLGVIENGAY